MSITKNLKILPKTLKTMKKINLFLGIIAILFLFSCSDTNDSYNVYNGYDVPEDYSGGEQYNEIIENPFINVSENSISTFSIDVDGGAYTNSRRFLNGNSIPPADAIRTEEFINYFYYNYAEPTDDKPISYNGEIATCPWDTSHKIVRIGIKGKHIPDHELEGTNFVFLIDVSGSMSSDDKLGLLKQCFITFVEEKISQNDKIAIVTYAGDAGVHLVSTSGAYRADIISSIQELGSGGSTAGAEGIITAYEIAEENFIANGNNRIIIGTDGDFNVGPSSQDELIELIEQKRETGIFITVLGVGTGNLNDGMLEQIANHGNGNYEYIDNIEQGKKVFIYDFNSFYTVAKDVKVQVTFKQNVVHSYRLIGYENRVLENEDFDNDYEDAGEIGSDQYVTALYELVLQEQVADEQAMQVGVRYKLPHETTSTEFNYDIFNSTHSYSQASEDFRFAVAVAGFALVMRNSEYVGDATYENITTWVSNASSNDPHNLKQGLLELISKAQSL